MELLFYEEAPISLDLIGELYYAVYSKDINREYWIWRFKNNPYEQASNIAYYLEEGKIVSFYSVSEATLYYNNELITCGLMNAAMTDPKYFGRGLYSTLEKTLHERLFSEGRIQVLYGFANHYSHNIHRLHMGWKDIAILNNFYCQSAEVNGVFNFSDEYSFSITIANSSMLDITDLMIYSSSCQKFNRSKEFLKWRIVDHPLFKYQFLTISKDNQIIALFIFKEYQGNADIMEIFYKSEEFKIDVLKSGISFLARKYNGIYLWSNLHSDEHIMLEKLKFRESSFNTYFGYISQNIIMNEKTIHYRFMDSDVY